jgi:hypothetical protein
MGGKGVLVNNENTRTRWLIPCRMLAPREQVIYYLIGARALVAPIH